MKLRFTAEIDIYGKDSRITLINAGMFDGEMRAYGFRALAALAEDATKKRLKECGYDDEYIARYFQADMKPEEKPNAA